MPLRSPFAVPKGRSVNLSRPQSFRPGVEIHAPLRAVQTGVGYVLRLLLSVFSVAVTILEIASAQLGQRPPPAPANIAYAPAEPAGSRGHLLDLYLPTSGEADPGRDLDGRIGVEERQRQGEELAEVADAA